MENEMTLLRHKEFGEVRTLNINGELWFVGKDVCKIFGDSNHKRSLGRVDDEDKKMVELTDSLGRKQTATAVNESGLYALLLTMQPQKAHHEGAPNEYPIDIQRRSEKLHRFKRWMTAEVLPSIRKHGAYLTDDVTDMVKNDPRELARLLLALADEQDIRQKIDE